MRDDGGRVHFAPHQRQRGEDAENRHRIESHRGSDKKTEDLSIEKKHFFIFL
jgi:hypothetical protein